MKKTLLFTAIILLAFIFLYLFDNKADETYRNLESVEVAQQPKGAESYKDMIRLTNLKEGQSIESPFILEGEARGGWYFEGDFPVVLTNWDGLIIAETYASAKGDWMTEEFVPFSAELIFEKPELYERGSVILQKDNPSGLPENDDAYEIVVNFK